MPQEMDHKGIRVIRLKLASRSVSYLLPKYLVTTVVRASSTLAVNVIHDFYSCNLRTTRDQKIGSLSIDNGARWKIWIDGCNFF